MSSFLIDSHQFAVDFPAVAADFDGTSGHYSATEGVGIPSKKCTFSFWIKMDGSDDDDLRIWITTSGRVAILRTADNKIHAQFRNNSGVTYVNIRADSTLLKVVTGWAHVFISVDTTAGVERRQIFINGENQSLTEASPIVPDGVIQFSQPNTYLGSNGSGLFFLDGCLYEFWHDTKTSLDGATELGKFYSGGSPVYLGANGERPTGSIPDIYFPEGKGDNNKGIEPDFTKFGTVTDCVSVPT